jgi:hypothetical protein
MKLFGLVKQEKTPAEETPAERALRTAGTVFQEAVAKVVTVEERLGVLNESGSLERRVERRRASREFDAALEARDEAEAKFLRAKERLQVERRAAAATDWDRRVVEAGPGIQRLRETLDDVVAQAQELARFGLRTPENSSVAAPEFIIERAKHAIVALDNWSKKLAKKREVA